MIHGETGTGKELIARALHDSSLRSGGSFVKLNCAAIPATLLESELFGHEKGAFTGALSQRLGRFEVAHRKALLLDEVGEIPSSYRPNSGVSFKNRSSSGWAAHEPSVPMFA